MLKEGETFRKKGIIKKIVNCSGVEGDSMHEFPQFFRNLFDEKSAPEDASTPQQHFQIILAREDVKMLKEN